MTRTHWIIVAFLGAAGGAGTLAVVLNGDDAPVEVVAVADAAAVDVAAEASVEAAEVAPEEPAEGVAEEVGPQVALPEFDAVRIEPDGSGVIAGRAAPGTIVALMVGGEAVAEAQADGSGAFVAFVELAPSDAPRVLSLSVDGGAATSESTVIVAPTVAPVTELALADEAADEDVAEVEADGDVAEAEAEPAVQDEDVVAEAADDDVVPEVEDEGISVVEDDAEVTSDDVAEPVDDVADPAPVAGDVGEVVADVTTAEPDEPVDGELQLAEASEAEETPTVSVEAGVPEDEVAADVIEQNAEVDPTTEVDVAEIDEVLAEQPVVEDIAEATEEFAGGIDEQGGEATEEVDATAAADDTIADAASEEVQAEGVGEAAESAAALEEVAPEDIEEVEASEPVEPVAEAVEITPAEVAPQVDVATLGGGFGSSDTSEATVPQLGATSTPGVTAETAASLAQPAEDIAPDDAPQPDVVTDVGSLAVPDLTTATASLPVLMADAEGVRVLQPALGPGADAEVLRTVALDAISYDASGDVVLSGRATGGGLVRIYLNNRLIVDAPVGSEGVWTSGLPGVETGVYTLRVDQVGSDGTVISRIETPFQREERETIAAVLAEDFEAADTDVAVRTVQPGNTLWGISQERYGEGILYVRVFEANRDLIRDPDLIYPGQILRIPDTEE